MGASAVVGSGKAISWPQKSFNRHHKLFEKFDYFLIWLTFIGENPQKQTEVLQWRRVNWRNRNGFHSIESPQPAGGTYLTKWPMVDTNPHIQYWNHNSINKKTDSIQCYLFFNKQQIYRDGQSQDNGIENIVWIFARI